MPTQETQLIAQAASWISERLPDTWSVRTAAAPTAIANSDAPDAIIDLSSPNGTYARLPVEARETFAPRDAERLLPGIARLLQSMAGSTPVLVVAPWLSRRSRELLEAGGINFLDLTGNARIQIDNPAVFIQSAGATRNPAPTERGRAQARGPKAARLIRALTDVTPPYGVREIAAFAELTPGYVSQLLDALDNEALVDRSRRGEIESVDVAPLLRRWAESYNVLKTNTARAFIAPEGAAACVERLADLSDELGVAVSGSFAAVRLAPVAPPALLLAYATDVDAVADALDLLPAGDGANVALLEAFDPVVRARATVDQRVTYVAPSQIAIDCLTGTGRMPAEGQALLTWMTANQPEWRQSSLAEARR